MANYTKDIPVFGCLDGTRVVFSATSIAGPFCCSMFADHGADVIWLENVDAVCVDRTGTLNLLNKPYWLENDRRNMRSMKLNFTKPDGKEAFLKLMADTDIFIESSKGCAWERRGLSDEELWKVNPKLVIVHLSGFGQTGLPEYVNRACYDTIAQAMGGMMYANSAEGRPPVGLIPYIADYYAGWACLSSALMAYIKVMKTGKGESVDLAETETIIRCGGLTACNGWNHTDPSDPFYFRPGDFSSATAGYDTYQCKDGNYILLLVFGKACIKRACEMMGLEFGGEEFPDAAIYKTYNPEGQRWNKAISEFCMQHDVEEAEAIFEKYNIPHARTLSYIDMLDNPQFQARDCITTVHSKDWGDKDIRVSNVHPNFKNNPGRIWKEAPHSGEDTATILQELGYDEKKIAEMMETGDCAGRSSFIN